LDYEASGPVRHRLRGVGRVRRAMEASDFGYHSVEHSGGRWARPPRMASMVMPSFAA
jgi:hypothetical protein